MSKYVISFVLLLITATAFCQKKSKVNLISSTRSHGDKRNGVDIIKVYDGVWKQDFSIMRSDSAYFYPSANAFEAFGHVNINQGDTLNIYSDKLNYDGNTKIAVLTDNVVMVDKDATLTTNHFNYNTATRIGTYTDGGKLVSKTNTLTSKNGYYFSFSHDAYFRYDVVGKTTDALIYTDTMRYNSQSKINYFYGPTRIYGTKDKDTLLTENGTYDTKTEQANFIKKNLYKQGTKTLIGDTLFYDRLVGYGRAVKHVTFNDEEQKVTIKGGLGTYFKKNDLAIVTRDPYIIMVTEEDDTTKKRDTPKKPLLTKAQTDSLAKAAAAQGKKGSVSTQKQGPLSMGTLPIMNPSAAQIKKIDTLKGKLTMPIIDSFSRKLPTTDSLKKLAANQIKSIDKGTQGKVNTIIKGAKPDTNSIVSGKPIAPKKTKVKTDSVYMSADTIETQIVTFKEQRELKRQDSISHIVDTSKVKIEHIIYKVAPKTITLVVPRLPKDTSYYRRDYFGPPKPKPVKKKSTIVSSKPKKNVKPDSTFYTPNIVLSDTARIRIIKAFHKAKIFKSDLQAVADSIFYSNSDSTIRCYVKPMIWAEGSQLSGDTVYLQLKNKKIDKMDMFPNAFIVNVEKEDSSHFNQVGGKKMRAFFKNSKLSRVYVDGNAETIYFVRDSTTKQITDMQRSFSSRLWVYMKNNEVTDLGFITKPENRYIPIHVVKEDEKILKGFLWKPKDRPVSKESILPSYNHKSDTTTVKPKPGGGLTGPKKINGKPPGKITTPPGKPAGIKAAQDTTLKAPAINAGRDTAKTTSPAVKPAIGAGKDTTKAKAPPVLSPAVQTKKDSIGVKP
ncbi:OstA-like protein [Mucilaginibacter mallensis]|uniref:OstA-like protein n=1 Tax=Mucilaginibacter mallensis TaxID=652787 RepID=A0A1H2C5J5_MUCMA|nr:OstA-like protein [Mucilaginibacter mallensis]SDT65788.1 OstA-like protein [Mucilaginibacter mallensis]